MQFFFLELQTEFVTKSCTIKRKNNRKSIQQSLVCMPFVFSKNSLPILTPNLAFVRPVAKALLASSNRDVDLMGSE